MMARNSVVLPAPLRPMSPYILPSSNAKDALRMIGIGPIDTLRSETLNMGGRTSGGLDPGAADQGLHAGIGQRRRRRAISDHGAVVKCQHTVGKALHDLHVVFDEQHGDLAGA